MYIQRFYFLLYLLSISSLQSIYILSERYCTFFFLFVVDFVIHWNETAMGLHVFPIPIPPPTSHSIRSP